MSYSLNSFRGIIYGTTLGDITGDARFLENGSDAGDGQEQDSSIFTG